MSDSFHDDSDTIAPVDEFASHNGDWTKGSDQEDDQASSPSDWGASALLSNDASRLTASRSPALSLRTTTQSKPLVPTYSIKEDVKHAKKEGDASSTKHKQPSRRSSGHQTSSSSNYDDRLRSSTMPYNSRSSHSRSHRRDDRDATLGEILTLVREQKDTIARLKDEVQELKGLALQNQDDQTEIMRICKAWSEHDDQYSAGGEPLHSDEGSQFADESNAQGGEGSSDTAYDASRDVSHAPADERSLMPDAEAAEQEMRSIEEDRKPPVTSPHDDELEPSRKRQRIDGVNDDQHAAQAYVPRYHSQQGFPQSRKNHHPFNNFNNNRNGFRGRGGRPYGYQTQGQHAPLANAGPYPPQGNLGFRHQPYPKQPFQSPISSGPNFGAHPQNKGPFSAPPPPHPRRSSMFDGNGNPQFIPNPHFDPTEDTTYAASQGPPLPMNVGGPLPPRGVKRPFQPDMRPSYGGEEFMQPQPPQPARPQWQHGPPPQQGAFQPRLPRRQQFSHPPQHSRGPLQDRIGN